MSEKIKIEKVEIKIAGNILSLTIEQAIELRDILAETFPKASTVVHHFFQKTYLPSYSPPVFVAPSYVPPSFPTPGWEVTYKAGALSAGLPINQTFCLAANNS